MFVFIFFSFTPFNKGICATNRETVPRTYLETAAAVYTKIDNTKLTNSESLGYYFNDGTSAATAFTSLSQARTVSSAGVYYFNLGGTAFSTYVRAKGNN